MEAETQYITSAIKNQDILPNGNDCLFSPLGTLC